MVVPCKQIDEFITECGRGSIGSGQTPGVFDGIPIQNVCTHLTFVILVICFVLCLSSVTNFLLQILIFFFG